MFGLVLVGGSFMANLAIWCSCSCLALCVGPTATAIHRLQGAKRIMANVLLNVTVLGVLASLNAPHVVQAVKSILSDCLIFWWDILCLL